MTTFDEHVFETPYGDEFLWSDLTPAAQVYFGQYGITQALQDVVAGMAKKLRDEGKSEYDIESALESAMRDRFAKANDGTIGHRAAAGPRKSKIESIMRAIATENIKAAVAAMPKDRRPALPKGDAWQAYVSAYVAKYDGLPIGTTGLTLRETAQARIDAQADATASVDLSALGL